MHLHALPSAGTERPRLVPDRVRDAEPPEALHQACPSERDDLLGGHPRSFGGRGRQIRHRASVTEEVRGLQVDEVRHGCQCVVDPLPPQDHRQRRLDVDHGVPRLELIQAGEDQIRICLQEIDERGIELGATFPGRDRDRLRGAADAMTHLDELRQLRKPRGDGDVVSLQVAGPPLPVPLLVRGRQRVEHLYVQVELVAQPPRHLRMVRDHVVDVAVTGDHELQPDAEPSQERVSRAELSDPGGGAANAVHRLGVLGGLQLDVVAEPLGLLVGIGMTSDVDEQRGVVDDRSIDVLEADPLREPERDQALPKDVLQRLSEPEVDAERERRDEFREPE